MKLIPVLLFAFISCQSVSKSKTYVLRPSDSISLTGVSDMKELHNLTFFNDSTLVAFSNRTKRVNWYKAAAIKHFAKSKTDSVRASANLSSFFLNNSDKSIGFLSSDNVWYNFSKDGNLQKIADIDLGLDIMTPKEYQFYSVQQQPTLVTDSGILVQIAFKGDTGFESWLKESTSFAQIIPRNGSLEVERIGRKPKDLKDQLVQLELFCKNRNKLVFIYPCMDSIFEFDLQSKKLIARSIQNPLFNKKGEKVDQEKIIRDSEYASKLRLSTFTYNGIFYSSCTKHYVLYFFPPVSSNIKVPTFDDQVLHAMIIDEQLKPVRIVRFDKTYRSTLSFLTSKKGIYMPLYKKAKHENDTIKYHVFDL